MGFREIVLGLIGVLLAYLAWLVLRLFVSPRKKKPSLLSELPPLAKPASAQEGMVQSRIVGSSLGNAYSSDVFDGDDDELEELPSVRLDDSDRRIHVPPEPDAGRFGFDALLEMRSTRHLVDELQRQYAAQQTEIEELRREIGELKAANQVSPFYGEAGALARRGYDAQAIAERCGISVAEAEMVCSLSKSAGSTEE